MMGIRGWGMYGMHGVGGGIMMILFWALFIIGIVYLVKNLTQNNNNSRDHYFNQQKEDSAIRIARERYAKGEITKEELNQILADLGQV